MYTDLNVSLDNPHKFVVDAKSTRVLNPIRHVYNSVPQVRLRFWRSYQSARLPGGSTLEWTEKRRDQWNPTATLAQAVTWVEAIDDIGYYYYSDISYATSELEALVKESRESVRRTTGSLKLVSGDTTDVIPFVGEIEYDPAFEGAVPTPLANSTYQDIVRFYPSVSTLTGSTANSLDHIATVGVTVPRLIAVSISGLTRIYQLQAGTDAESSPNIIRPDDYNASTNAKVWALVI